ncbi:MAG: alpha/beta hydrolase [Ktedonobacteraceae bacterium]
MTTNSHTDGEDENIPSQPAQSSKTRLAYGSERLQFGELHLPTSIGPFPIVILIHGGFWRNAYGYKLMTSLAADLAKQGIAAWNIEYRRIGDAGGGWPSTLLDVAQAADYLRSIANSYALDLRRVVAAGHSAGGHLALWLAARPHIAKDSALAVSSISGQGEKHSASPLPLVGVVSQAGVADLEMGWRRMLGNGAVAELLGGGLHDVPERYAAASPAALLPLGVPQVLIHGTADDRVPFNMSEDYARAARAAGDQVTLIKLEGEDHFVLINVLSDAWVMTVQSIRELFHLD